MNCFFSAAIAIFLTATAGIYDYTVSDTDGNEINFDSFRGKKILIVNIATGSPRAAQLGELQQLHEQHGDSLVIIGFPSNSFGGESRSNAGIKQFCGSEHGVSFLLAAKGPVNGSGIQPLYQWLTRQSENGATDSEVRSDFQKYLIDRNGGLLGVFAGSVSPLSQELVSVITGY